MKRVVNLNQSYNTLIEQKEDTFRNINWSLKSLEWDNLFNYGEDNRIDFSKLEGIVGIFGKNFSGKSSIVDSLLFSLYNSTSKSIRKNLNIINQNQDKCVSRATIEVGDKTYRVERTSEKYIKKLKGEETLEAKTDLEFDTVDLIGNVTSLNGTSRQDTDKNIRKYFGTLDDFLLTSMASQMGSLNFVNEGSTKRKEILAKFLDLEIFDKKFKMAKEDSSLTRGALKKLSNVDYDTLIDEVKDSIIKNEIAIETNRAICDSLQEDINELESKIGETETKINSVPAEIIDITSLLEKIDAEKSKIETLRDKKASLQDDLKNKKEFCSKAASFLNSFDIDLYEGKRDKMLENEGKLNTLLEDLKRLSEEKYELVEKCDLLCADCTKIVRPLIDKKAASMSTVSTEINDLGTSIDGSEQDRVLSYINKFNQLKDKKELVEREMSDIQVSLEKNKTKTLKSDLVLKEFLAKEEEYENNREAIENLEMLHSHKSDLQKVLRQKNREHKKCHSDMLSFHKSHGSLEERLKSLEEQKSEYKSLATDFAAYDLLMTCCHPNGISYDIIKERLPIINQEIAKILTNIVDFEIFIKNEDNKLDIFIKHPKHDPRPLEMGSGAEKTIASMAIRLAFLTVSSLPKSDLFILDEPGTALDEENMEGFVRILDMVKNYFKTVILISHLDTLKDCVDMQISIERKNGYAHVNI